MTPTVSPVPLPVIGPSGVPPAFPSKDASNAASMNHPKLAGPLAELADAATQARERGENIDPSTLAGVPNNLKGLVSARLMRIGSDNRVQVYVEVENLGSDTLGALKAAGVVVEREDSDSLIVQGRVPIDRLDGVAGLEGVKSVRLPDYGFTQSGSVVTEGDAIIRADDVRSSFGVTGSGVRVGVISDGVGGLAAAKATGDLPSSVDISTCNVIGGSDPTLTGAEGTAMLEIVHDIAPGAELWFGHCGMGTSLDFNAAVDCLASHTDVVVDDI